MVTRKVLGPPSTTVTCAICISGAVIVCYRYDGYSMQHAFNKLLGRSYLDCVVICSKLGQTWVIGIKYVSTNNATVSLFDVLLSRIYCSYYDMHIL